METVMTDDKKVKKLGMKDIQRDGWEYELTVSLNLDRDTHTATPSKDRTEVFERMDPFVITEKTGELIRRWCESGIEAPKPEPSKTALPPAVFLKLIDRVKACKTAEELSTLQANTEATCQLSPEQTSEFMTAINDNQVL